MRLSLLQAVGRGEACGDCTERTEPKSSDIQVPGVGRIQAKREPAAWRMRVIAHQMSLLEPAGAVCELGHAGQEEIRQTQWQGDHSPQRVGRGNAQQEGAGMAPWRSPDDHQFSRHFLHAPLSKRVTIWRNWESKSTLSGGNGNVNKMEEEATSDGTAWFCLCGACIGWGTTGIAASQGKATSRG